MEAQPNNSPTPSTIARLLTHHGTIPLSTTSLAHPSSPTPETLLALLLNALLSSARISHTIAARATAKLIDAGYHRLATLKKSTFEERCGVLAEGGYARYREKMAGELGELMGWLTGYDGDLKNLVKKANEDIGKVRELLKGVKGLGDVGVDIFIDTAQWVLPDLAPFLDPRSKTTAERIGLGSDVQELYKLVGEDPMEMCKLASALTSVRLEKVEDEFMK